MLLLPMLSVLWGGINIDIVVKNNSASGVFRLSLDEIKGFFVVPDFRKRSRVGEYRRSDYQHAREENYTDQENMKLLKSTYCDLFYLQAHFKEISEEIF